MLRRATGAIDRARERIRIAREHDPHAWHDGDGHEPTGARSALGHDEPSHDADPDSFEDRYGDEGPDYDDLQDDGPETDAPEDAGGATRPPLGSPRPGAPDLDGVSPSGVSGPPSSGRRWSPAERTRLQRRRDPSAPAEEIVPNGLRMAAAWAWRLIVVLVAIYVVLYAASYVAVVVVPVIVALMLSALLQPGAAGLVRRGWPRTLAAVAMLVVGLAVIGGILTLVIERFSAGFADLANQVSEGIGQVQTFIVKTFPITRGQLDDAVTSLQDGLVANRSTIASGALTTAATVGEVITGMLLTLFTLFFFLKDGRSIWLWLVGLFPRESRAYIDEAARRSWRTLISYVRATAGVALVDAFGIGIGLAILGVPLVIPLAALVYLGAFIPIIGSFLAGSVAVLVALVAKGPLTALITLAIVVLVMQVEGHVLQPLLLGRAVRVHPLAVILSITAGLLIAGIFGALIAVPTVACANVAGTYLSRRHEGPRPPEPRPEKARPLVDAG